MSVFIHSHNTGYSHPFSSAVMLHIFYIIQHTLQSDFAFPVKYLTLSHSKCSANKAFTHFTKKKKKKCLEINIYTHTNNGKNNVNVKKWQF